LDTLRWLDDINVVEMVDQTIVPNTFKYIKLKTVEQVARSIEIMQVRGAPAIGVTAAMGVALGATKFRGNDKDKFLAHMETVCVRLAATRPTAVNLFWAIERMKGLIQKNKNKSIEQITAALIREGKRMRVEDIKINKAMGMHGATLLKKNSNVLTHCNAGSLATAAYGTALGVVRAGYKQGKVARVYADETRPRLQGAMLTAFEMVHEGIPCTLNCDNTAATLMAQGKIDCCIVGADRIASNGDTANKIGTYSLAVVAKYHKVPFYVAAPISTIDYSLKSGKEIPIEHRSPDEVRIVNGGKPICPDGVEIYNQAFDVTPESLVAAIITEKGVCRAPYIKSLAAARDA
jgi:methylthioribose-1-phosphate isomerase